MRECRPSCWRKWTPTGARRIIFRSGRSIYKTTLCSKPRSSSNTSSLVYSGIGARPPGFNFIYVHLNRLIKETRSEHDLCHRPRSWRSGAGGAQLSRRVVHGTLSGNRARSEWTASALSPVLLALWSSQSRIAGNSRLNSRRRRTGLFARPRLWCRFRQSGSDRRLHHRRRRGGNWRAGHQLAFQQVSESRTRRRGASHPSSQRVQDRKSDCARAHQPSGIDRPDPRLRL